MHPHRRRAARTVLPVVRGLLASLASLALLGCGGSGNADRAAEADAPPPDALGDLRGGDDSARDVEPGSFKVAWRADVDTDRLGPVNGLYLRGDSLVVYTDNKAIQRITTGGRTAFVTNRVARPIDLLYPPLLLDGLGRLGEIRQFIAFPKSDGYTLMTLDGDEIQEVVLSRALTSSGIAADGVIYVGAADDAGGRLLQIDPTKRYIHVLNRVLFPGASITSRPAFHANLVYAADAEGRVYGLNEDLTKAWQEDYYSTEVARAVEADLSADSYGVYVAGTDGTLYCLDRLRGTRRWRYLAGRPLLRRPIPTDDWVYLPIPDRGVAAISKTQGSFNNREPAWLAEGAVDFVSHDDRRVYLLHGDGAIVAHDKESGRELFRSERTDLRRFARNEDGPRIYAATRDGEVLALDPVTGFGEVGETASLR